MEETGRLYLYAWDSHPSDNSGSIIADVSLNKVGSGSIDSEELSGWVEYISEGNRFSVVFNKTAGKFNDSNYTGDWKTDPLGSVKGGETYSCTFNGSYSCTGFYQTSEKIVTMSGADADPNSRQISLWGLVLSFDENGNVYSSGGSIHKNNYGLVGELRKGGNKPVSLNPKGKELVPKEKESDSVLIEKIRFITLDADAAGPDLKEASLGQELHVEVTLMDAPATSYDPVSVDIRNLTTGLVFQVTADVPTQNPRIFLTKPIRIIASDDSNDRAE